jgi:hypothetical protein
MTPNEVIVSNDAVFVQWTPNGPFMAIHEDGSTAEQFRTPGGQTVYGGGVVSTAYRSFAERVAESTIERTG